MKHLIRIISLIVGLATSGAIGFRFLTGAPWVECFFLSVITLTTVGSREPVPLDDAGMVFVMLFLVSGLGVFTYSGYQLGYLIVNAGMRQLLEARRMHRKISQLEGHFIVCGLGRVGTVICRYFSERKRPFVVIEQNGEMLSGECADKQWLYIQGDATDDGVLRQAGIARARALTSVLPTDGDNLYVVLSARMLNNRLQIVARASEERARNKLKRAGADRVISLYNSGAIKMARFMLHPSIEDFIEIADESGADLEVADVQISHKSPWIGKALRDTDLSERGVMIIAIRRTGGERLMPPPGDCVIHAGDSLFAFGSTQAVNHMIEHTDLPTDAP